MQCELCGLECGNAGALANHTGSTVCEVRALAKRLKDSGWMRAGARWQTAKRNGGEQHNTRLSPGFKGKRSRVESEWWLAPGA